MKMISKLYQWMIKIKFQEYGNDVSPFHMSPQFTFLWVRRISGLSTPTLPGGLCTALVYSKPASRQLLYFLSLMTKARL